MFFKCVEVCLSHQIDSTSSPSFFCTLSNLNTNVPSFFTSNPLSNPIRWTQSECVDCKCSSTICDRGWMYSDLAKSESCLHWSELWNRWPFVVYLCDVMGKQGAMIVFLHGILFTGDLAWSAHSLGLVEGALRGMFAKAARVQYRFMVSIYQAATGSVRSFSSL